MNEYKITISLFGHTYKTTVKAPDEVLAREKVLTAMMEKIKEGLVIEQVGDDLSFLKTIFDFK